MAKKKTRKPTQTTTMSNNITVHNCNKCGGPGQLKYRTSDQRPFVLCGAETPCMDPSRNPSFGPSAHWVGWADAPLPTSQPTPVNQNTFVQASTLARGELNEATERSTAHLLQLVIKLQSRIERLEESVTRLHATVEGVPQSNRVANQNKTLVNQNPQEVYLVSGIASPFEPSTLANSDVNKRPRTDTQNSMHANTGVGFVGQYPLDWNGQVANVNLPQHT